MNREDVIRIYKQVSDELCDGKEWCLAGMGEPLERFAALVAAAEHNALMGVLEKIANVNAMDYEYQAWARDAIRARGQT